MQDYGDGGAGQRVLDLGLARRAVLAALGAQVHAIAGAVVSLGPPGPFRVDSAVLCFDSWSIYDFRSRSSYGILFLKSELPRVCVDRRSVIN